MWKICSVIRNKKCNQNSKILKSYQNLTNTKISDCVRCKRRCRKTLTFLSVSLTGHAKYS